MFTAQATLEASSIPDEEVDAWAQFNILNGVLTGVHKLEPLETMNTVNFEYRQIRINRKTQKVVGDVNTYRVVNIAEEPEDVFEVALDSQAEDKIAKVYSIEHRLNTIEGVLMSIAQKVGVEAPELYEINEHVKQVYADNELRKRSYAADPEFNYISRGQMDEESLLQHEGGLHELAGPRAVAVKSPI